jgi:hypothetical protein
VIVAHHGGELQAVLATLVGTAPVATIIVRARLTALGARLRRRPREES